MKTATARQHAEAFMVNAGPKVWAVVGKWDAAEPVRPMQAGLTYRQARATARAIREACGYANVVKAA